MFASLFDHPLLTSLGFALSLLALVPWHEIADWLASRPPHPADRPAGQKSPLPAPGIAAPLSPDPCRCA